MAWSIVSNAADKSNKTSVATRPLDTMGGTVLSTTVSEKDLWLSVSADMKGTEQYGIAAAKGNQILGLIRHNIVYK